MSGRRLTLAENFLNSSTWYEFERHTRKALQKAVDNAFDGVDDPYLPESMPDADEMSGWVEDDEEAAQDLLDAEEDLEELRSDYAKARAGEHVATCFRAWDAFLDALPRSLRDTYDGRLARQSYNEASEAQSQWDECARQQGEAQEVLDDFESALREIRDALELHDMDGARRRASELHTSLDQVSHAYKLRDDIEVLLGDFPDLEFHPEETDAAAAYLADEMHRLDLWEHRVDWDTDTREVLADFRQWLDYWVADVDVVIDMGHVGGLHLPVNLHSEGGERVPYRTRPLHVESASLLRQPSEFPGPFLYDFSEWMSGLRMDIDLSGLDDPTIEEVAIEVAKASTSWRFHPDMIEEQVRRSADIAGIDSEALVRAYQGHVIDGAWSRR